MFRQDGLLEDFALVPKETEAGDEVQDLVPERSFWVPALRKGQVCEFNMAHWLGCKGVQIPASPPHRMCRSATR